MKLAANTTAMGQDGEVHTDRPRGYRRRGQLVVLSWCAGTLLWCGCGGDTAGAKNGTAAQVASGAGNSPTGVESPASDGSGAESRDSPPPLWPPGLLDLGFDDIKFDMEKRSPFSRDMLTDRIEQLEQREIRIRGYILPSFQQRGITQFVLVRDNMECCFGPGAALFDCILVDMEEGQSTSYTIRPVRVDGTFSIRELKGPDGTHLAIYHMTGRRVK